MVLSFTEIVGYRGALAVAQAALCRFAAAVEERERRVEVRDREVLARETLVRSTTIPHSTPYLSGLTVLGVVLDGVVSAIRIRLHPPPFPGKVAIWVAAVVTISELAAIEIVVTVVIVVIFVVDIIVFVVVARLMGHLFSSSLQGSSR